MKLSNPNTIEVDEDEEEEDWRLLLVSKFPVNGEVDICIGILPS